MITNENSVANIEFVIGPNGPTDVRILVHAKHRWSDLHEYLNLVQGVLNRPKAVLKLGEPEDKPSK